ncbi:MAG TPA: hypothetical protein DD490_23405 [Acidobacteria bacterium]|nr:hypothetical protein [Acidobacteriota bacterium]
MAERAGLMTRSRAGSRPWQLVNRIAIEELEAWYFGDWTAVCSAYPKVAPGVPQQAGYRDADAIRGGTREALERALQQPRHRAALAKWKIARAEAGGPQPELKEILTTSKSGELPPPYSW